MLVSVKSVSKTSGVSNLMHGFVSQSVKRLLPPRLEVEVVCDMLLPPKAKEVQLLGGFNLCIVVKTRAVSSISFVVIWYSDEFLVVSRQVNIFEFSVFVGGGPSSPILQVRSRACKKELPFYIRKSIVHTFIVRR